MRVLAIVHQRDAGPGVFADAIRRRGAALDHWIPPEEGAPPRPAPDYDGVLVLGGAMHANQERLHPWLRQEKALLRELVERDVPVLGVCLGAQLLAEAAGAPPRRAREPEIGWYEVEVSAQGAADSLLGPLAPRFSAFQWHSYELGLPEGATALAKSDVCLQAYRIGDRAWGIQFHAEVSAADVGAWLDDYAGDEDALRMDLDVDGLRDRTEAAIEGWNALGRSLCGRFLDAATRA